MYTHKGNYKKSINFLKFLLTKRWKEVLMFSKRPDGRVLRTLAPMERIMPYVMKTRNDSMNMYQDTFNCAPMDEYIKAKAEEGIKLDYMDIVIAAVVRIIALYPVLNRFVMNGRIYARPKIWVSFTMHPKLKKGDVETTIKMCFEGTETITEIAAKIDEYIAKETTQKVEDNATDQFINKLMKYLPSFLIKLVVDVLMWMDKHNIMPKFIVDLSPFHTSLYITNLKSLGINHIFHHVYNFGTTGLFIAMGKEKKVASVDNNTGEVVMQKHMGFGLTSDERFCDGLHFALALRHLRKIMKNPACLEIPLEKKVEDID